MATNESARAALAQREAGDDVARTPAWAAIERMRPQFSRVIADSVGVERFVRVALTELRLNPGLAACSEESIMGALMTAAQLRLEPGRVLGEAYLVPYGEVCTFIIGYKGLIKLAWQSGLVTSLDAQSVHEKDDFRFRHGSMPYVQHDWDLREPRGRAYAWWAGATLKGGGFAFTVMGREDIERIRTRSRAKDSGPWKTDYDAMARKTCLRQLSKFLPLSVEMGTALANDEAVRTDVSPDALEAPAYDDEHVQRQSDDEAPL